VCFVVLHSSQDHLRVRTHDLDHPISCQCKKHRQVPSTMSSTILAVTTVIPRASEKRTQGHATDALPHAAPPTGLQYRNGEVDCEVVMPDISLSSSSSLQMARSTWLEMMCVSLLSLAVLLASSNTSVVGVIFSAWQEECQVFKRMERMWH
jgi:hypothetical protein